MPAHWLVPAISNYGPVPQRAIGCAKKVRPTDRQTRPWNGEFLHSGRPDVLLVSFRQMRCNVSVVWMLSAEGEKPSDIITCSESIERRIEGIDEVELARVGSGQTC